MTNYNRFGATFADVLPFYSDVVAKDFGGQLGIEPEMDRAARRIAAALAPSVYSQLTAPDLELIVQRATAGQGTAQLSLFPIVTGSVRIWRIASGAITDQRSIARPIPGYAEASGYTVTASTGAITGLSLGADDLVFASYRVDTTSAAYDLPSLGEVVSLGAAAELGSKLYAKGSDVFQQVERLQKRFEDLLAMMAAGAWIPDELRFMRWFTELEPTSAGIQSLDLWRA